jgi:hypothetical protein
VPGTGVLACEFDGEEKNRVFARVSLLTRGMPCVLTWLPLPNWRLCRAGANGIWPFMALPRDRSTADARTKLSRRIAVRPNSPDRTLVTAFVKRALRYTFTTLVFATTPKLRPRPYHGRKGSCGASGTHPTLPNPKLAKPAPNPGEPHPKNPTNAGLQ